MTGGHDLIVVGGGAAGMMAAISAARMGADVCVVERNQKVGRKLYITGKGRCNVTNHCTPEEALAQAVGPAAQPLDVAYGTGPIQWALVYTNPEEPGRACFLLQTGEGEHRPVTMGDEESGFVYLPDSLAVEGDTVTASFREGEGSDQVHDLSLQFTRPAEGEVRFTTGETLRTLPEEEA